MTTVPRVTYEISGDELRSTLQASVEKEYQAVLEADIERVKSEHAARVTAAVDKAVAAIRGKAKPTKAKAAVGKTRRLKRGLPRGDMDRVDDLVPPAVSDAEL